MPGGIEEGLWKREQVIGCGGQAQVFLATTYKLGKHIESQFSSSYLPPLMAVKSVDSIDSIPLIRESKIIKELADDGGCQNIITLYGVQFTRENGQMLYNILLEFADGGSLSDRIGDCGLPEIQVRDYTKSILSGLKYIHDHGYVHRDIKPENILICKNNIAKIADFGHSKKLKNPLQKKRKKNCTSMVSTSPNSENKKKSHFLKGTPLYMAPETVIYGQYSSSCDVWALGCVVLEMLTGKRPWNFPSQTTDIWETLSNYIASDTEYPIIPTWVSSKARDFLDKCFIKNPRDRWNVDKLLSHPFIVQFKTEINEFDDLPRPNFAKKRQGIYDDNRRGECIEAIEGNSSMCKKRLRTATDDEEKGLMDSDPTGSQEYIRYWCIKRPRNSSSDHSVDNIPFVF
ncbi:hypothetical protein MKX03_016491 [Papaver bracteatum]|nr:hypothetical protein MKX03_016491 [Papaver bracteatum]